MGVEALRILDIPIHRVTTAQTLALMEQYVAEGTPHQVVTLNPEFVMEAQQNAPFRVVIDEADLVLADGHGLLWAARVLGDHLPERVTGSDTVPLIAERAAQRGYRLFLLGAAPGVAEQAAQVLQRRYPGLVIAGTYAGSPAPEEQEAIVARIRAARPHFLFVAYGAPRQDIWIHRNLARLGVPVCLGVGARWISSPALCHARPSGCASTAWSGSIAWFVSPGAGAVCWLCPDSCCASCG
jgi:N-acetylglucosaminyldiphosphoundecaprenol N-acetyl-beta-D-mannosaminyltransferase